jgi:uncharacterized protein
MSILAFTPIVLGVCVAAGFVGALTGLGGGVIVTPVLTLLLGVDIRYAIGASLVSVIATSSGAAAAYVRDGYSNLKIGMFLEIATTFGALFGAFLATRVPTSALSLIFGFVLLHSAWQSGREHSHGRPGLGRPDPLAKRFELSGTLRTASSEESYVACRVKAGFALMFGAGTVSGLLGIGSGALKVIAMDQAMQLPFKVSTATSNFMIGVTAAASAGIYFSRGYIDPGLAMPVMLGVLCGSILGARLLPRLQVQTLRRVFAVVVAVMALEMIVKGMQGAL